MVADRSGKRGTSTKLQLRLWPFAYLDAMPEHRYHAALWAYNFALDELGRSVGLMCATIDKSLGVPFGLLLSSMKRA